MTDAKPVILVVEDELLIRMDVCDQLLDLGCDVLEASTGAEAQGILASGNHIDLVFTDVDMPGETNGIMLAREIADRRPAIPVIVTSGKLLVDPQALPQGVPFVPKPYNLREIHEKMRSMIAATR